MEMSEFPRYCKPLQIKVGFRLPSFLCVMTYLEVPAIATMFLIVFIFLFSFFPSLLSFLFFYSLTISSVFFKPLDKFH
jgi:hypothetical protein